MHTIRVHSLAHARFALTAAREYGCAVRLLSPCGVGGFAGIGWWRELVEMARAEFPGQTFEATLDCGPSAGMALAALRAGVGPLWLDGDAAVSAKIAGIAEQAGFRVDRGREITLDLLGTPDPGRLCREALENGKDHEGTEA